MDVRAASIGLALTGDACMSKSKKVTGDTTEIAAPKAKPTKSKSSKTQPIAKEPERKSSKLDRLVEMLRQRDGATIDDLTSALDWQAHSVRGAISGALTKKRGLKVLSEKPEGGQRRYRIAETA